MSLLPPLSIFITPAPSILNYLWHCRWEGWSICLWEKCESPSSLPPAPSRPAHLDERGDIIRPSIAHPHHQPGVRYKKKVVSDSHLP